MCQKCAKPNVLNIAGLAIWDYMKHAGFSISINLALGNEQKQCLFDFAVILCFEVVCTSSTMFQNLDK